MVFMNVTDEIRNWIEEESYSDFYDSICSRVIGQDNLNLLLASIYNYLISVSNGTKTNNNIILAAPSGCGKTESYRALKDYFKRKIPFLSVEIKDMAAITPTGYKGDEPITIVEHLKYLKEEYPVGLVFLDEMDKIILPAVSSRGHDSNRELQYDFLKIIEDGPVTFKDGKVINTDRLMFIGMGAFDYFREKKIEKKTPIGFGSIETKTEHYDYISRNDIIKAGGCYELIGRFPLIINYDKLSKEAVDLIIDKYILEIREKFDCDLIMEKDYREEIHKVSNGKFGCREIYNSMTESVMELYSKALLETVDKSENKLSIMLSANKHSYKWRALTEEEKNNKDNRETDLEYDYLEYDYLECDDFPSMV